MAPAHSATAFMVEDYSMSRKHVVIAGRVPQRVAACLRASRAGQLELQVALILGPLVLQFAPDQERLNIGTDQCTGSDQNLRPAGAEVVDQPASIQVAEPRHERTGKVRGVEHRAHHVHVRRKAYQILTKIAHA